MFTFQEHCWVPARCAPCRQVVSVDVMAPRLRCPKCGRKPLLYGAVSAPGSEDDDWLSGSISWQLPDEREFVLDEHSQYECPRCTEATLSFTAVGDFD
jgi:predicted RNA-binding Zn-ribbon protein involved in translation (DUF1610 family)